MGSTLLIATTISEFREPFICCRLNSNARRLVFPHLTTASVLSARAARCTVSAEASTGALSKMTIRPAALAEPLLAVLDIAWRWGDPLPSQRHTSGPSDQDDIRQD